MKASYGHGTRQMALALLAAATMIFAACGGDQNDGSLSNEPSIGEKAELLSATVFGAIGLTAACSKIGQVCASTSEPIACAAHGQFCSGKPPALPTKADICRAVGDACTRGVPQACVLHANHCGGTGSGGSSSGGSGGGGGGANGSASGGGSFGGSGPAAPGPGAAPGGGAPPAPGGGAAPAPGGGAGGGTTSTLDTFEKAGPYKTARDSFTGPWGTYSVYHPTPLGKTPSGKAVKHPIITWGNGTGAPTLVYAPLLTHLASHGFVVVATNSPMTGLGLLMRNGITWLSRENDRKGSKFFETLDPTKVCATGHSQGGAGAINAGNDPRVKCTAPIAPVPGNVLGLRGPMFLVAGNLDLLVAAPLVTATSYLPSPVPTVYGILAGATHSSFAGNAGRARGYLTAWFAAQLRADAKAKALFYGKSCGLCGDSAWRVLRKNLP